MAPVMVAALFWKRSTKWGALAATLWVAFCLSAQRILELKFADKVVVGKTGVVIWQVGDHAVLWLSKLGSLSVLGSFADGNGFMPVVPMVLGSIICVIVASLLTTPPSRDTIEKYFGSARSREPIAGNL